MKFQSFGPPTFMNLNMWGHLLFYLNYRILNILKLKAFVPFKIWTSNTNSTPKHDKILLRLLFGAFEITLRAFLTFPSTKILFKSLTLSSNNLLSFNLEVTVYSSSNHFKLYALISLSLSLKRLRIYLYYISRLFQQKTVYLKWIEKNRDKKVFSEGRENG